MSAPAPAAAPALKDGFADATLRSIAAQVKSAHPGFAQAAFLRDCRAGFEALSLMQRVGHVARMLQRHLPDEFSSALGVVESALGDPPDRLVEGEGIAAFARAPFLEFVALAGLAHPETALPGLRRLTRHFTAEFAIRPFLAHHLELSLTHVAQWVHDEDARVRRLASEGTRPLLPWGRQIAALKQQPQRALSLIAPLAADADEVVRRSAANHLNDVSRLDADLALDHAARWHALGGLAAEHTTRHALRSLIKAGQPRALALLGYDVDARVELLAWSLSAPRLVIGESIDLVAQLRSRARQPVLACVDYAIAYASARGTPRSKVFKGVNQWLAPGEVHTLHFVRDFVPRTTRKLYAGAHRAELLVNGQVLGGQDFELLPDAAPTINRRT